MKTNGNFGTLYVDGMSLLLRDSVRARRDGICSRCRRPLGDDDTAVVGQLFSYESLNGKENGITHHLEESFTFVCFESNDFQSQK